MATIAITAAKKPKNVDIDDLDFDSITFQEETTDVEDRSASPEKADGREVSSPRAPGLTTASHLADGSRLSPVVSAETEALMKRLHGTTPTGTSSTANRRGSYNATSSSSNNGAYASSYSASMYGTSPSFADLVLTKTAESLAHSTGVAAENANAVIIYGEPGTALQATALLEAVAALKLDGEVLRHWLRDGQHFCFVEFASAVDTSKAAKKIGTIKLDDITLTAEPCSRITPGRDPRTHRAESEFKSSTLVLKNLPFQLRQETLAEILARLKCQPQTINYHYDTTGAFRGMAFVKYHNVDDAFAVFDDLNGLDIMGRALRVEYKRRQGDDHGHSHGTNSPRHHHHHHNNHHHHHHHHNAGHRNRRLDPNELSADARAFYDQLVMFKQNPRLHELAFPPSLTVHQRKQLHYLADHVGGLAHFAVGDGAARFLVVSKDTHNSRGNNNNNNNNNHNNNNNNSHKQLSRSPNQHVSSRSWTADKSYLSRSPNQRNTSRYNASRDNTGSSYGSYGRNRARNVEQLSSSPGTFSAMMEQRRHEDGEWENATGGRRSRSNTGSANAANNTVRQPKGPDGGSRGFGKR